MIVESFFASLVNHLTTPLHLSGDTLEEPDHEVGRQTPPRAATTITCSHITR